MDAIFLNRQHSLISKVYQPSEVEKKWYTSWLENNSFAAQVEAQKPTFSIVMPPPNVTGILTMGHVLNNTLQDILIRNARQQGKTALWIPGTDHAGISTQIRVEKELAKEHTTRQQLGRTAFIERTIQWRNTHGGLIYEQLKRLGIA